MASKRHDLSRTWIVTGIALLGFALVTFLLLYRSVVGLGFGSLIRFPRVLLYLGQTAQVSGPGYHPLSDLVGASVGVPYDRPLGKALDALGLSLLLLALATGWIFVLSVLRVIGRLGATRNDALGTICRGLRIPDWALEQFQRLPGIVVYLLVGYLFVLLHRGPLSGDRSGTFGLALRLALLVANSDGFIPDMADLLTQRYRDLCRRDYVKVGRLEGQSRLAVMRRELTMSVTDLIGSRLLQIVAGAFLLELILSYPGIGRTCVMLVFQPSGLRGYAATADAIAKSDALYCVMILMVLLSATIILGRKLIQSLLDPRPRIPVAR